MNRGLIVKIKDIPIYFDKFNIEKIFLIISLTFGITFAIVTPPFQTPDELVHFYRAYQVSTGQLLEIKEGDTVGGYLPSSLVNITKEVSKGIATNVDKKQDVSLVMKFLKVPLNKDKIQLQEFSSTVMYTPIVYMPQCVGINLGKMFNASPLILMYFGRISNLIIFSVIMYIVLKLMPFKKNIIFLIGLTPMILAQAGSLSGDAITNALSFLCIALVLNYAFGDKKKVVYKDIIILFTAFTLLALCKQVYFIFCFLFLIIPYNKFKSKKQYFVLFGCLIFVAVSAIITWSLLIKNITVFNSISTNISVKDQIKFVISHPIKYIIVLLRTIHNYWFDYLKMYIGVLGWLDTTLPVSVYRVYIFIYLLILFFEDSTIISYKNKIIAVSIFIISFVLVMSALYASWSPVGNDLVIGVQGRYFIPIVPLISLVIGKRNKFIKDKYLTTIVVACVIICLSIAVRTLIFRFYGIKVL